MRTIAICLFFLLSVASSSSQERTLVKRTFDNAGDWFAGETSDGNCTVENEDGVMRYKETDDNGFRYFSEVATLDNTKNWSIRIRLRQTDGEEKHAYGIAFNAADVQNVYMFVIRDDDRARIGRMKENAYEDVDEWTKTDAVKKQGEWNVLEVRKENDAISGYVNGKAVVTMTASYFRVFGSKQGVLYYGAQTIEMDDLEIRQWEPKPVRPVLGVDPNVKPVSLGAEINGESDESVDCISSDGSVLYFSRKDHDGNVTKDKRDVWVTTKMKNGSWSAPKNLGAPINTAGNNFAIAVTQDLNTLFLQGTYESDGSMGKGVSYSTRTKDGWSAPVNMAIDDYENLNSYVNSHLSPDGSVLITSIQTRDSRGSNDLYVCFRKQNNTWTAPKNLGSVINTQGSEMGPFIAGDGKTLFFSTTGHPGYGGRDIFVSRRLDDTWLNWSEPENLGNGVNSDEHETFIQVPARGDSAYYSSTKNSLGQDDIVAIALPSGARPVALLMARGRVLDAETKLPVTARVVYEELPSGRIAGTATSSAVDGSYRVGLVNGNLYGVRAEAEGYYALSEQFDARSLGAYVEADRDLYLTPIKMNVAIRLNNVFFDVGKYDLRTESYPELDRLVEFLQKNPSVRIALAGHTDNVGSDADNLGLSQNRINSVQTYLVSKGTDAQRMTAKGFGESKPMAPNETEEGRQQNRRVEFTIVSR
ncbi:MAG: OmpA family protein [Candidatus Kapabacteria bacterium]|nr:OmpA family protein [Candidatus Kapabacteria bacterium]